MRRHETRLMAHVMGYCKRPCAPLQNTATDAPEPRHTRYWGSSYRRTPQFSFDRRQLTARFASGSNGGQIGAIQAIQDGKARRADPGASCRALLFLLQCLSNPLPRVGNLFVLPIRVGRRRYRRVVGATRQCGGQDDRERSCPHVPRALRLSRFKTYPLWQIDRMFASNAIGAGREWVSLTLIFAWLDPDT